MVLVEIRGTPHGLRLRLRTHEHESSQNRNTLCGGKSIMDKSIQQQQVQGVAEIKYAHAYQGKADAIKVNTTWRIISFFGKCL